MKQDKSFKFKTERIINLFGDFLFGNKSAFRRSNRNGLRPEVGARSAFTVAELLIAVGLFTTIITIAIGAYIKMLQQQSLMTGLMSANDNVSLVLEQMMREIRTGKDFNPDSGNNLESLNFVNDRGCKVTYSFSSNSIRRSQSNDGICEAREGVLTSENVKIGGLSFNVSQKSGAGVLAGTNFEEIEISIKVSNEKAAGVEKENEIRTRVSARKYFGE
jgi:Tfp pilus assembly major pilin PilA